MPAKNTAVRRLAIGRILSCDLLPDLARLIKPSVAFQNARGAHQFVRSPGSMLVPLSHNQAKFALQSGYKLRSDH